MKNYYFISSFEEDFESLECLGSFLIENHDATKDCVFVPSSLIEYPKAFEFEENLVKKLGTMGISFPQVHRLNALTSKKEARRLIENASFIYLHGGNPLVLYETLKYFGIIKSLKKVSCNMMGLSAGAMVMGENIVLTPTSEEYPDFVIQKALGFGKFNIMPHINCDTIYWPIVPTRDGPVHLKDLQQQSQTITIQALRDYQHLSVINKTNKINQFPLLIFKRQQAYVMNEQGLHPLYSFETLYQQARQLEGYRDCWLTQPQEKLTEVTSYYNSFTQAFKEGYLKRLAGIDIKQKTMYPCYFRLLGFYEKSLVILQSNFAQTMVFLILSPQLEVGTIVYRYDETLNKVVETFSFRSRFGKFADEYKIKGMIL